MHKLFIVITVISKTWLVLASAGDRSPYYIACVEDCEEANCTGSVYNNVAIIPILDVMPQLLFWSCPDDCRYNCMWKTISRLKLEGRPSRMKFYGKWPFLRYHGIQEPASAVCSLLNLLAHWHMYRKLRRRNFPHHRDLVIFWKAFAFVCMHAWLWSTIFHTRDFFITEFMDYACALSMIMALFAAAVVRVLYPKRLQTAVIILTPALLYYVFHVEYLYGGRIDYEYNMTVNIVVGIVGSTIWVLWSMYHFLHGVRYVTSLIVFNLLSGAFLSLELFDFPPYLGVWDSHALWHLSTVPLPLLFYRFVIDDLEALSRHSKAKV